MSDNDKKPWAEPRNHVVYSKPEADALEAVAEAAKRVMDTPRYLTSGQVSSDYIDRVGDLCDANRALEEGREGRE